MAQFPTISGNCAGRWCPTGLGNGTHISAAEALAAKRAKEAEQRREEEQRLRELMEHARTMKTYVRAAQWCGSQYGYQQVDYDEEEGLVGFSRPAAGGQVGRELIRVWWRTRTVSVAVQTQRGGNPWRSQAADLQANKDATQRTSNAVAKDVDGSGWTHGAAARLRRPEGGEQRGAWYYPPEVPGRWWQSSNCREMDTAERTEKAVAAGKAGINQCHCHIDDLEDVFKNPRVHIARGGTQQPPPTHPGYTTARENASSSATIHTHQPPATGTFRVVFKGTYNNGPRAGQAAACKVFKSGSVYEECYFEHDVQVVNEALRIIDKWTAKGFIKDKVMLNRPTVWTCSETSSSAWAGQKHLIEPWIDNWHKYNSNTGWKTRAADDNGWHLMMQAMSHYSYHESGGQHLLCDLQGGTDGSGRMVLTDPAIMSVTCAFGPTDLGSRGISSFFAQHECNVFCRSWWCKPKDLTVYFEAKESSTMVHHQVRRGAAPKYQFCKNPETYTIYE